MDVRRGSRRRRLIRCGVLASCVGLLACVRVARADERGPPLECGSRQRFDAELRQRLGHDAPVDQVQATITKDGAKYHLRVQIGRELRELDDPSCPELLRAAVVISVAMLLHPAQPAVARSPRTAPPQAPQSPFPTVTLTGGSGFSAGILPKPAPALELESQLLWKRWGVGGHARYYFATDRVDTASKGVQVWAMGAGVTGIFRPSRLWAARFGFAVQRLSGEGIGKIASSQEGHAWAAGPTLGLSVTPIQTGHVWAELGVDGQVHVWRGRFEILHYSRSVTSEPASIYAVPGLAGAGFVRVGLFW